MGKKQSSRNAGIGDSLKSSLSKLTGRVTLKAPSPEDLEKARSKKVADRPKPATPTPMSAPQTEKAKPAQTTPKAMQQKPAQAAPVQQAQVAKPAQAAPAQQAQVAQPAQAAPAQQAQVARPAQAAPAQQAQVAKPVQAAPAQQARPAATTTKAASKQPVMAGKGVNNLANDVVVNGKLRFNDRLVFNGHLMGEIESEGSLAVQPEAVIEAKISVGSIFVEGKVVGDITATESVRLAASAIVIGDISTGNLTVEPEATFQGQARIGKTLPANAAPAASQVASGEPISGTINSAMPAPAPEVAAQTAQAASA